MSVLRDPPGWSPPRSDDDWTPQLGLLRGARAAAIAALIVCIPLGAIAAVVPHLLLAWGPRCGLAFLLTWLMLRVVQNWAGMASPWCSALALAFVAVVLFSNHAVFAVFGVTAMGGTDDFWIFPASLADTIVTERNGLLIGPLWLHPYLLIAINIVPMLLGGGFGLLLHGRD